MWKRKTSKVYTANGKRKAKRMQINKVLWIAEKYAAEEAIYFPMQYDFRGRIYCLPMYLSPQGADVSKGLLTFASGKAITDERAAGWLMIHGANTYGFDKVSLEERIEWTVSRTDDILAVAADPLANTWWSDADKPWQFLAFCFEYAAFQAHGYGYVSRLPIALDGSCNGLQHFSAMLRDPIGGKAVNLLPSEKPNDIYQTVCDQMVEKLKHLIETEATATVTEKGVERVIDQAALARQWMTLKLGRALTKRPVMVLPYGGTIFSCREYVEEWLEDNYGAGEDGGEPTHPWGDDTKDAISLMSKLVWDSIGEVVVAARQAMDWLQRAARVAAAEGLPVTWATPDGFHVLQAYPEVDSKRVKTQMGDSIIKLTLTEELPTIDRRRQANGISPNYVHSMDASALRLYVTTAKENGIGGFALIHDSYGTLAADTDLSVACLREAFVAMYQEENHLEALKDQLLAMLPEERHDDIPNVPPMGTLDLEQVRQADYFFA
jgi:DNA-directed RNA polymerase